ncbi:hypothetical protein DICA0_E03774 [Diutina catenulata]
MFDKLKEKMHSNEPGVDTVDGMDPVSMGLHHDGPYDAALPSENRNPKTAPMGAFTEAAQRRASVDRPEPTVVATDGYEPAEDLLEGEQPGLGDSLDGVPASRAAQREIGREEEEQREAHESHHHHHKHHHLPELNRDHHNVDNVQGEKKFEGVNEQTQPLRDDRDL